MRNNQVPFASLRQLLIDLGFQEKTAPDAPLWYEHPPSGTILLYRKYAPTDSVSWVDWAKTRKFLDERGVLEADEFEERLHGKATLNGPLRVIGRPDAQRAAPPRASHFAFAGPRSGSAKWPA